MRKVFFPALMPINSREIPKITKNPKKIAKSSWLPKGVKVGFFKNCQEGGRVAFLKGEKKKKIVIADKMVLGIKRN